MDVYAIIIVNKMTNHPTIINIVTSKYVADRKVELLKEQYYPNYSITIQKINMEVQFLS